MYGDVETTRENFSKLLYDEKSINYSKKHGNRKGALYVLKSRLSVIPKLIFLPATSPMKNTSSRVMMGTVKAVSKMLSIMKP